MAIRYLLPRAIANNDSHHVPILYFFYFNSTVISKKLCARENGGVEYDATNTDTTIPIDER